MYYAKSALSNGKKPTVKEHLLRVSELAAKFGEALSMGEEAASAGLLHDFGKYSEAFQMVLQRCADHVDHALPGALLAAQLYEKENKRCFSKHMAEAIIGHHDGLKDHDTVVRYLSRLNASPVDGKTPSITDQKQFETAINAFRQDFSGMPFKRIHAPCLDEDPEAYMLYTRMLFSCLVDADYSASASDENEAYLEETTDESFDAEALLRVLYHYRDTIQHSSNADPALNVVRGRFFDACGCAGEENETGLFTLTGPTGVGKTLALIHFALRHCKRWGKKRIIVVLPYLSLTEQTAAEYGKITESILEDTSQASCTDKTRELSSRWSMPFIITTSVKFFESLFSDRPTDCRKLHHIADSVVLFDEAQSLPSTLLATTLKAVRELCGRYHATMVFSTATQPDFSTIDNAWHPTEIIPDNVQLFHTMKRACAEWRIKTATPLSGIAREMSRLNSVCAIVNLRKHARELFGDLLNECDEENCFFLTTDLCARHRSEQIRTIKEKLRSGKPCRVVATQCIEAGVDLDFDVMFRALAPLEAIIQAAGRCNRNGRLEEGGRLIVFRPESEIMPYPEKWYERAAAVVDQMYAESGDIDIHDPAVIQQYYRYLFLHQQDKQALTDAIQDRDYEKTRREYRLIESRGVQVIVPYGEMKNQYENLRAAFRKKGLARADIRGLAPYTVTFMADQEQAEALFESIPFFSRRNRGAEDSGYYLLRPQDLDCYSETMGLQMDKKNDTFVI